MIIYDANGVKLLDIEVEDTSVRYKAINGDDSLTLNFSLAEHLEIPIGSWCEFKGQVYSLMSPSDITMQHRRSFNYNLVLYSEAAKAKRFMFINPVDGRLKFSLTAYPQEHLQMFVDNMNNREPSGKKDWKVGECIEHERITLSYNMTYCHDALVQLANQLELDYWFDGKTVNLGKLEVNKESPLPLSYGGDGQGLKSGIKRTNYSDALPIEILYVKGSEENIDFSKYGSNELHLPVSASIGYDGVFFSDEDGFNSSNARWYIVDENGYSVRRSDKEQKTFAEDSLDCSEITPTKEEVITHVDVVDKEKHFYDLYFSSDVDYKNYQIAGETAYIVFQTGMLAGKQFDLATRENGTIICELVDGDWRIELKPQEIDGITMPDSASGFTPEAGNTFKVFGIQLPEQYISNPATRTGAEWDMLRYAVKHLYANEVAQYTISGELDEIFAKRNWGWISDKIVLGGFVSFSDKSFQEEPILIRITGIKEYVNKPYSPQLELSNQNIGGTVMGTINRIENQEVYNEQLYRDSIGYTKRRYRDVKETASMLQKALLSSFSDAVSPITINTMQAIVGDEALQFQFIKSKTDPEVFTPVIEYGQLTKKVTSNGGWIQHMTLGIKGVTSTRALDEYRFWKVGEFESEITDVNKPYYLYIKAEWNSEEADFELREEPIAMDAESGLYYYFLTGILNTEIEGERSFVRLYGYTEVLPGQITTDIIRSSDGQTYFDLVNGVISGDIKFIAKGGEEKDMADFADEQKVEFSKVDKNVQNLQDQIDGVVENHFYEGTPTTSNYPASEWLTDDQKINHIGDTYTDISEIESDPNAGKSWRWCRCDDVASSVQLSGRSFPTDWYKIGTIDATKTYFGLEYYYNGTYQNTFEIEFDKDIQIVSGPPTYVKIESATGDVYVKDAYGYFSSNVLALVFKGTDYVEVTDKDGVTYKLHWHPIADTDAVKALLKTYELEKRVDDVDFLRDTFKKGETSISGGVVMTEMVAVGEGGSNVEAFLNGSDFAESEDSGKLILAGGIPTQTKAGSSDLEERAKEAKIRMYEDGDFVMKGGGISVERGNVGPFYLNEFDMAGEEKLGEEHSQLVLSRKDFSLTSKEGSDKYIQVSIGGDLYSTFGSMMDADYNVIFKLLDRKIRRGIRIETKDSGYDYRGVLYINRTGEGDKCAIEVERGFFAGLRPNTRVIKTTGTSTDPHQLDNLDHTIIINEWSNGRVYLKLPEYPQIGQVYEIYSSNAKTPISIDLAGNQLFDMVEGSQKTSESFDSQRRRYIKLVYTGEEWWETYWQF